MLKIVYVCFENITVIFPSITIYDFVGEFTANVTTIKYVATLRNMPFKPFLISQRIFSLESINIALRVDILCVV